jgi:hypothetical protein
LGWRTASGFGNLRYGTADFQVGCIADFQIGWTWPDRARWIGRRPAGLETRDTAGLETCAGLWQKLWRLALHFQGLLPNFQFRIWLKFDGS